MKKSALLLALVVSVLFIYAQKLKDSNVPSAVKSAFAKKFPKAKEVKWSKENTNEFEAKFETGNMEQSANFDHTGKWLGTETEIKKSELPQAVQASIIREFADFKIEETEKAEFPDKDMVYEVELTKGKLKYEVQLSADGKVVRKEEMKD